MGAIKKAFWDTAVLFYQKPYLLVIALLGVAVTALWVWILRPREVFMEHLRARVGIPLLVGLSMFILVFLFMVIRSPYAELDDVQAQLRVSQERERSAVTSRTGAERQLRDLQGSETGQSALVKQLREQVERLSKAPKVGTTAGVNAAGEAHQCWLDNHFESPNPHVKEARTATTAIIHCNYRVDAPWIVAVKFDREFLYGNVGVPGSGVVMGGGSKQEGNIFVGEVSMPSVPANQLITVTVEGPSEQFPRALSGNVRSK